MLLDVANETPQTLCVLLRMPKGEVAALAKNAADLIAVVTVVDHPALTRVRRWAFADSTLEVLLS